MKLANGDLIVLLAVPGREDDDPPPPWLILTPGLGVDGFVEACVAPPGVDGSVRPSMNRRAASIRI